MASGLRQVDNVPLFEPYVADTGHLLCWKFSEQFGVWQP